MSRIRNARTSSCVPGLLLLALCAATGGVAGGADAAPPEVQAVTPPADAEARRQAFAERNSPEQIAALAKRFFSHWDFQDNDPSRTPATDSLRGERARIVELYRKQDYAGALAAYRTYFFAKVQLLAHIFPARRTGFDNFVGSADEQRRATLTVEQLMRGEYQPSDAGAVFRIGEPGTVDWGWQAPIAHNPWDSLKRPTIEYFCDSAFNKLWWAFVASKDARYLGRWQAYLDDYATNDSFHVDLSALNLDLGKAGMGDTMGFIDAVARIGQATPAGGEVCSAATLARMMLLLVEVVIPQGSFYNRQQSNNHSPSESAKTLEVCDYIFDFTLAKTLEVETRRQVETYATVEARPDGASPGRLPEYAMFEFKESLPAIAYFNDRNYPWLTPMVNREYRDRMLARARFMTLVTTPTGEYRVAVNTDDRRGVGYQDKVRLFGRTCPELYDDPDMFRIAGLTMKTMARPDWQGHIRWRPEDPLANTGLGSARADQPAYDSFSFPYDRIYVMGNGWNVNEDQYGVLVGSAAHRGDSFMKENKATNHLGLSAFNRDIFRSGVSYAYNYLDSPVQVDGQDACGAAGEGPTARRAAGNYGFDPISPDRNLTDGKFAVAESLYDWAYANSGTHDPSYYRIEAKLDVLKRAIWGTSHRRIVQFVKEHGFWVVTDLMTADKPHEYAQQWWLAENNREAPDGFSLDQVHADAATRTMRSDAPNDVNFTMYHVGPADLDHADAAPTLQYDPVAAKPEQVDGATGGSGKRMDRHDGFQYIQLRGTWKSQGGRSQLVTVVYPRKTVADGLVSLTANAQGNGFTAILKDGAEITYAASFGKPSALSAGGLSGTAESLLVVKNGAALSGVVMGCSALTGPGIARNGDDFAFDGTATTPIYRPIQPVEVSPGVAGFADEIVVTMKTATAGTEIRYSVDGNDPTLSSPLYSGPVTFTDTVMVKARAFRTGLRAMPPLTPTGTEMTGVATAVYTREPLHAPDTWTKATQPGLAYDYYEAKWPFFIYGIDPNLKALRSGTALTVLDTAAKSGQKEQAFAFAYHGYLDVPADGVYTIYAPAEFSTFRPLCGYDLKVRLGYVIHTEDGKQNLGGGSPTEVWYPATRRHAFGTWSVGLKKGLQPFAVTYADMRPGARLQYGQDDYAGWNVPGLTKVVWDGDVPTLEISGPGLERQAIPKGWLRHE